MKLNCRNLLPLIILCIAVVSCKNNDNVIPVTQATSLTIINASADTLNYYLNGTRQNNTSALFPTGVLINQSVPAGMENYQFKKYGTANVLFSKVLTLKYNSNASVTVSNSLYIYGESSTQNFTLLNDTLVTNTGTNVATIRFTNASPDAGAITASIGIANSANTISFNNIAFTKTTSFSAISSGLNELKVYVANNPTPKIDTTLNIQPNSVNTIFTKGLLNGSGSAVFTLGAMVNK